jgi:hypothetical protein
MAVDGTHFTSQADAEAGQTPELSVNAYWVLTIIQEAQTRIKRPYPGQVVAAAGDQPRLDLSKNGGCIISNDFHAPSTCAGDYSVEEKEGISFGSSLAVELLSQVQPGKMVKAKGKGISFYHHEEEHEGDALEDSSRPDEQVQLMLAMKLGRSLREVTVLYAVAKPGEDIAKANWRKPLKLKLPGRFARTRNIAAPEHM